VDSQPSYKLITEKYLPEDFLHPAYFFLRPDGTEADEANRHHHEALPGQRILKILKAIARDWGRGLDRKSWLEAKKEIALAELQCLSGGWEGARERLTKVAALRARCGVKEQAKALLATLDARHRLLEEWRGLEGVPEVLVPRVAEALAAGNFPDVWRAIRNHRGSAKIPPVNAFREKVEEVLLEGIRLKPVVLDRIDLSGRTYWTLKAEWETTLPEIDGLVVQLSYLTERERTHESYVVLDDVRPYARHRAACCLDSRQLRLADVVNLKVELWLDDLPLHTSRLEEEPARFPEDESHVLFGPDLMEPHESLAAGGRYEIREFHVGRYPGAR
jgi:hypothetical protein